MMVTALSKIEISIVAPLNLSSATIIRNIGNNKRDGEYQSFLVLLCFNPLPHLPILGSSKSVANKNMMSKIWKNGVQLSDWVENNVEKGEIACYEQFLLFPQCFQKLLLMVLQNEYLWSKGLTFIWYISCIILQKIPGQIRCVSFHLSTQFKLYPFWQIFYDLNYLVLFSLTLYSINTHFDTSTFNNRQLLKTLWEKEKLQVTSNFFSSHNVLYSIR